VANQKLWINFCEVTGMKEWLEDPRFESNPKRVENREILLPLIDELFAKPATSGWRFW
jgi:crotonobetainyl-CoA:carnitine CoA-transferase CaiB-like acyl-CoA transferase